MIEITRSKSLRTFRISPTNPLQIDWRLNKHGARWGFYMVADSPNVAKRILLQLERDGKDARPEGTRE